MPLANLAITEDVADLHQLLHQADAALVVPRQVVAIGEVERIDVPVVRVEALGDNLQRQLVR